MTPSRGILRTVRTAIAAGVLATVGLSATPASAVPVPPGRLTLTTATQSFTSSTGHALRVNLGAAPGKVTVNVTTPGQPESHTWTFSFPDSSEIAFDPDTRTGSLTTGTAMAPFGSANLTLTPIGAQTVVGCGRARVDVQPVSVRGAFGFATSSSWGSFGSRSPFSFTGNSTLTIADPSDKLCGSTLPPCVVSSTWEAHNIAADLRGFTQFIGTSTTVGATTTSTLLATRLTYLAAPANATRTDTSTFAVPNPVITYNDPNATVKVTASPHVQGSAVLNATPASENKMVPLSCGDAMHRTVKTEWLSTFTNGNAALTVPEQIEGAYALTNVTGESNTANATIDRIVTTTP